MRKTRIATAAIAALLSFAAWHAVFGYGRHRWHHRHGQCHPAAQQDMQPTR